MNNWDEFVIEDFTDKCAKCRIEVGKVYYTGFGSQGDGACFKGELKDWQLYIQHYPMDNVDALTLCLNGWVDVRWDRGYSRYCHENTLTYDVFGDPEIVLVDNPNYKFEHGIDAGDSIVDWVERRNLDPLYLYIEAHVRENIQTLCKQLYRELERAYDYEQED